MSHMSKFSQRSVFSGSTEVLNFVMVLPHLEILIYIVIFAISERDFLRRSRKALKHLQIGWGLN